MNENELNPIDYESRIDETTPASERERFEASLTIRKCHDFTPKLHATAGYESGTLRSAITCEDRVIWFHAYCQEKGISGRIEDDFFELKHFINPITNAGIALATAKATIYLNDTVVATAVATQSCDLYNSKELGTIIASASTVAKNRALANAGFGSYMGYSFVPADRIDSSLESGSPSPEAATPQMFESTVSDSITDFVKSQSANAGFFETEVDDSNSATPKIQSIIPPIPMMENPVATSTQESTMPKWEKPTATPSQETSHEDSGSNGEAVTQESLFEQGTSDTTNQNEVARRKKIELAKRFIMPARDSRLDGISFGEILAHEPSALLTLVADPDPHVASAARVLIPLIPAHILEEDSLI